jgi:hypothetical protein
MRTGGAMARWFACVYAAMLALGLAGNAAAADAEAFTARLLQAFRGELSGMTVESKAPLALEVVPPGQPALPFSLQRLWDYCARNERDCDRVSGDYVQRTTAMLRERLTPIEPKMIRLVLGPSRYVEQLRQNFSEPAQQPIAAQVAGDLWLIGVADYPTSMRVMNVGDLQPLGLSPDEAVAVGKRNLAGALEPLDNPLMQLASAPVGILEGDAYESSRILLHDSWAGLAGQLGGLIVAVPDPAIVLFADAKREGAVAAMRDAVRRSLELSPRKLSPDVLQWTPEGWRVLPP